MKLQLPTGQSIEGEQLTFTAKGENWSDYELSDGNTLRIKVVLAEVYRLNQTDPMTGKPSYAIKATDIISVVVEKKP